MNKIPFNAPGRQYSDLKAGIDTAVQRVLESGWYLLGSETSGFEADFAHYLGVAHCVSVANGTDALEIALRVAGCGPDSEVITVANAGGYTTVACNLVGARPVYVDVSPDTLLMSIEAALDAVGPNTRVVVATHLYGSVVDVPQLRSRLDAAGHPGVLILEDCAQAHGARLDDCRAGSMGELATFSFYPTKNLGALGDGGAVVCQSEAHAEAVKAFKQYGWDRKYHSAIPNGRNSRLDELQAAVLRVKLKRLDDWNARRREIIERYRDAAPSGWHFAGADQPGSVGHLCVVQVDQRDDVRARLQAHGVATDIHYPVLDPDQPMMASVTHVRNDLTHSARATGRILSLPCFAEMTDAEIGTVCGTIGAP
ncbi:MAG: DegT/DnrJ/EryC1/StrS family aminotransferase [Nitrospirota bacterium]|nr:DegT/DnrJ/EryC1/StrS family aminotransferase [Nitrospirota bacterium]